jgi:ribose transport system substrate-binding protein
MVQAGRSASGPAADLRRPGLSAYWSKLAASRARATVIACDWKDDCAYDQTLTQTKSNPDITAIFAAWDPGALAAVSAAKQNGKLGDLTIVGFDGNPGNLESIKAGEQAADIKQDNTRMGSEGVKNLLAIIKGDKVPKFIPIAGILIDKSNVADFMK